MFVAEYSETLKFEGTYFRTQIINLSKSIANINLCTRTLVMLSTGTAKKIYNLFMFLMEIFRYLLCEIILPPDQRIKKDITESNVYHAIKDAIQLMHGDFGLASVSVSLRGT